MEWRGKQTRVTTRQESRAKASQQTVVWVPRIDELDASSLFSVRSPVFFNLFSSLADRPLNQDQRQFKKKKITKNLRQREGHILFFSS
jgi:hypothetical protein